jgi:tetratricopeptide (TPR) repeat protein
VVGVLAYPKIFKQDTLEKLRSSGERISVAVMPFQNMTNDTIWNVWQGGIQDILITSLSNSEELKVRQTESVKSLIQSRGLDSYTSITPAFASSISQKLDANVFICGNIKQAGSTLRVYAQLIDSKTEEVFKSFQIEDSAKEDNIFKVIDSLSMMVQDFLIISKLMKEENPDVKKYQFTTKYPEAFKCVIRGNYAFYSKRDYPAAINMYLQAIAIDSNYIWPAIIISDAYYNQSLYEEGKKWYQKVYEKKEQMPVYFKTYANMEYSMYYETPYESIKYLKQLLEIDDQLPEVYFTMGINYKWLQQYSKAIPVLEKSLEIYEKWGTKPLWVLSYTSLARAYHETGQYKKGKILLKKAEKDFPDETMFSTFLFYAQAVISFDLGDTIAANRYIEKYISIYEDNSWSEANIMTNVANLYNEAGIFNKAEELYRQALSLEPESPRRLNSLAYFLVDKDRNINEGLELAEKALVLSPDHYEYLHIKGWGLYKQGKNKEALDILQKSWDLRIKNAIYDHEAFLHLEAAKKAVANQKKN